MRKLRFLPEQFFQLLPLRISSTPGNEPGPTNSLSKIIIIIIIFGKPISMWLKSTCRFLSNAWKFERQKQKQVFLSVTSLGRTRRRRMQIGRTRFWLKVWNEKFYRVTQTAWAAGGFQTELESLLFREVLLWAVGWTGWLPTHFQC